MINVYFYCTYLEQNTEKMPKKNLCLININNIIYLGFFLDVGISIEVFCETDCFSEWQKGIGFSNGLMLWTVCFWTRITGDSVSCNSFTINR